MNNLYSYYLDCGRQGSLEGLFIATPEEVQNAIGKDVYFGEVLGKHSEVGGTLELHEFKLESSEQDKVEWLLGLLGRNVSGLNPLGYVVEDDEEDLDD